MLLIGLGSHSLLNIGCFVALTVLVLYGCGVCVRLIHLNTRPIVVLSTYQSIPVTPSLTQEKLMAIPARTSIFIAHPLGSHCGWAGPVKGPGFLLAERIAVGAFVGPAWSSVASCSQEAGSCKQERGRPRSGVSHGAATSLAPGSIFRWFFGRSADGRIPVSIFQ